MKVKVLRAFRGLEEGRILKLDEVLTVSEERGLLIIKRGLAEAIIEKPRGRPRKRKEPAEDKALRPSEDKGAG